MIQRKLRIIFFRVLNSYTHDQKLKDLVAPCISNEENEKLILIPCEEEIKDCVWSMHPLKCPVQVGTLVFSTEAIGI